MIMILINPHILFYQLKTVIKTNYRSITQLYFTKKINYASLNDICNRQNINTNQLNLLENFNYQYFDNFVLQKNLQ